MIVILFLNEKTYKENRKDSGQRKGKIQERKKK